VSWLGFVFGIGTDCKLGLWLARTAARLVVVEMFGVPRVVGVVAAGVEFLGGSPR
jgi:hypothetical protein